MLFTDFVVMGYRIGMDYSLRELECFIAVAEELSFTRAAAKLRLAQPPLSRHVRVLEEKLGAALFERRQRRVTLTPAGQLFYEETRTVPPQLRAAGETTRRFAQGRTRRLRLGFVSAVLGPELAEVLKRFRGARPEVQLQLRDGLPSELLEAMRRGELDGAFVGLRPDAGSAGIAYRNWITEPLAVFVPEDHALAKRDGVALKELAAEPMVAVSNEAAPAFASFVRSCCAEAGFRPKIIGESARGQAVVVMVAAGGGIALLPASLARVVAGTTVSVVPLKRAPKVTHVFARHDGSPGEVMAAFLRLLGE